MGLVLQQAAVPLQVLAEVDDMAMLRLLARDTGALALVPPAVAQDERASVKMVERCRIPHIAERFHAFSVQRRHPHPLLKGLLSSPWP